MAGNPMVFSEANDIPEELPDARKFVTRYGPKASAVIPMWAASRVIGAASFRQVPRDSRVANDADPAP